jgi:ABC-type transport system involved in cytochrome bd biosynthesis fused ATPase/permease subunit
MKTATALTVASIGAILAFAVTAEPSFFSFHTAGWVLMITGVVGAIVPRRSYGWLRRRLVIKSGRAQRSELSLRPQRFSKLLVPGGLITEGRDAASADAPVESDTIEEFIED